MKRRLGTVCVILGAALILAALALLLWNRQEDANAAAAVGEILPQVSEKIQTAAESGASLPDPYDPEMTEKEIEGYSYIGYLSIPSLSLELPVMAQWDYDRLKIAPCRYFGSTKTGNLVIVAHNYSHHFGNIKDLSAEDDVYFTDMDGTLWAYRVAEITVLEPTAVEEMTAGDFQLTLFTCTYGGQSRVTVRCDSAKQKE